MKEIETREQIDDEICRILIEDGPDGHVDGHEKITDYVLEVCRKAYERGRRDATNK